MLFATEALSKSSFEKAINTQIYRLGWTATVLCVTSHFIPTGKIKGAFQMYVMYFTCLYLYVGVSVCIYYFQTV